MHAAKASRFYVPYHRLKMLSQFQASYQRVEQSLQKLTDSIAAYNPSISAAEELSAADDAVNKNLEQRTCSIRTFPPRQSSLD